jgi:hypothetical protein
MESSSEKRVDTIIGHSGNSDVDLTVNIDIDTKAIAYGLLCSLFAKGEITEQELDKAIQKLDHLIDMDKENKKRNNNNTSIESRPKLFNFPSPGKRRNWL